MALFGTKKTTKAKKETAVKPAASETVSVGQRDLSHILSHARITEKASMHQTDKVYTFDISDRATKRDIIRAVYQIYKVMPKKIRTVSIRTKSVRHAKSGKMGVKGGGKKAYVYLKSGDSIIIS